MSEKTITLPDKESMRERLRKIDLPYLMGMCDPYILGHAGLEKKAEDIVAMLVTAAADYILMGQGSNAFHDLFKSSYIRFKIIEALVDDQEIREDTQAIIRRDDFIESWP